MSALALLNLTRKFGSRTILRDFNLKIESGEFVSILGASGSGKSTLLRLIAGLDRPDAGLVQLANASKSYVFQDPTLLAWRNLRENLELVFELKSQEVDVSRIDEVLSLVRLEREAEKYPAELSGGMRMRASVARALLIRPQLLLLDEPFSALDENSRHRLQEDLREIWLEQKMTTIFVTHSMSEAVFLSNRAIVIGGEPSEIVLDHRLDLPAKRNAELRLDPKFISEIKLIAASFSREE